MMKVMGGFFVSNFSEMITFVVSYELEKKFSYLLHRLPLFGLR
jgi:hypothetical protein